MTHPSHKNNGKNVLQTNGNKRSLNLCKNFGSSSPHWAKYWLAKQKSSLIFCMIFTLNFITKWDNHIQVPNWPLESIIYYSKNIFKMKQNYECYFQCMRSWSKSTSDLTKWGSAEAYKILSVSLFCTKSDIVQMSLTSDLAANGSEATNGIATSHQKLKQYRQSHHHTSSIHNISTCLTNKKI